MAQHTAPTPSSHTLRQKTPPHTRKTKKNNLPYIAFSAIAYITKILSSLKTKFDNTKTKMWQTKYMKKKFARDRTFDAHATKRSPHITTYTQTCTITHRVINFRFVKFFETFIFVIISKFLESKTKIKHTHVFCRIDSFHMVVSLRQLTIKEQRLVLINQLLFFLPS